MSNIFMTLVTPGPPPAAQIGPPTPVDLYAGPFTFVIDGPVAPGAVYEVWGTLNDTIGPPDDEFAPLVQWTNADQGTKTVDLCFAQLQVRRQDGAPGTPTITFAVREACPCLVPPPNGPPPGP